MLSTSLYIIAMEGSLERWAKKKRFRPFLLFFLGLSSPLIGPLTDLRAIAYYVAGYITIVIVCAYINEASVHV